MKRLIFILGVLIPVTLFLASCGKSTSQLYPISLKLELPQSLAKGEKRREKFMARAEMLIVKIETKEGGSFTQSYAKEHWEKIILPGFEFPKSLTDKAEVSVEIHALDANGVKTTEAVLKGQGTLYGKEMKKDAENKLSIKLSLNVQPETWD